MLPVLLVSVDGTALSFAVPMISAAFDPTGAQLLWIVDVYPLVLAGLLVPMGSTGIGSGGAAPADRRHGVHDRFGAGGVCSRRQFAHAARLASRAFGAMLMPSTLSLIRNIFCSGRAPYVGHRRVWAAGFSGGAALGPIAGGFLLEHF